MTIFSIFKQGEWNACPKVYSRTITNINLFVADKKKEKTLTCLYSTLECHMQNIVVWVPLIAFYVRTCFYMRGGSTSSGPQQSLCFLQSCLVQFGAPPKSVASDDGESLSRFYMWDRFSSLLCFACFIQPIHQMMYNSTKLSSSLCLSHGPFIQQFYHFANSTIERFVFLNPFWEVPLLVDLSLFGCISYEI